MGYNEGPTMNTNAGRNNLTGVFLTCPAFAPNVNLS